jgi:hypothetical protein
VGVWAERGKRTFIVDPELSPCYYFEDLQKVHVNPPGA